ncbi:phosphotransferase family protein [Actinoplanes sp. NPDC051859]|uniref:phosphotransferase family protein n=1 Tax=Actinoplanes sp. NPDC051859 TaxID=3363909 RepID=UPI0037BCBB12
MTATALRPAWARLPVEVRDLVENRLGARIRAAVGQDGGFTPGVAARAELADGSRAFVKAIEADDELADQYRNEARCAALLGPAVPAPRLRFTVEAYGWVVLAFDDVAGRHPDLRSRTERAAVSATLTRLATLLTPTPVPDLPTAEAVLAPLVTAWRQYAAQGPPDDLDPWAVRHLDRLAVLESGWAAAVAGDTLLHLDLRADNMLLTPAGEVVVVDWACASRGAAWVDLAILLVSAEGVDADRVIRTHPLSREVPAAAIDAFVCALAGCFARESRGPALPRSPYLRDFQAAIARHSLTWLIRRTGWR